MKAARRQGPKDDDAKTDFLQIRITRKDRERIAAAAEGNFLDISTWARQSILKAVAEYERSLSSALKVAEPKPGSRT
jgi:hypothetical protein